MIPDILINVEAHIMGHAATFMRMREEAELDWLSVSLLRRMVLVRSQVLSLLTPHININDMLIWPNIRMNVVATFMEHECSSNIHGA